MKYSEADYYRPVETREIIGDCREYWGHEIQRGGMLKNFRHKVDYRRLQGTLRT